MDVRRNEQRSRYELFDGDAVVGVADYREQSGRVVVMPHTEIDPDRRGHGLGAVLVRGALEDLRARGVSIVPACWFVAEFIDEHPDYQEMVAA
jgi:predicted GNAT family acetyltransferase